MNFEEFVKQAHNIVPVTETVFCRMNAIRFTAEIDGSTKTYYEISVVSKLRCVFSIEKPTMEECLTELKKYFDNERKRRRKRACFNQQK